jgi:hypothetical protein
MIAVGQTDEIVFVYKIGADWGEKKVLLSFFFLSEILSIYILYYSIKRYF